MTANVMCSCLCECAAENCGVSLHRCPQPWLSGTATPMGVCAAYSGLWGTEMGKMYLLVQRTLSSGLGLEASLGKGIPRECPHSGDCDREAWLRMHGPARGTARKHQGMCLETAN